VAERLGCNQKEESSEYDGDSWHVGRVAGGKAGVSRGGEEADGGWR